MTTIVVLFNLKPGLTKADYSDWVKIADLPSSGRMPSVDVLSLLKAQGLFEGTEVPPYQHIELFQLSEEEAVDSQLRDLMMQKLAAEFEQVADNPMFILAPIMLTEMDPAHNHGQCH